VIDLSDGGVSLFPRQVTERGDTLTAVLDGNLSILSTATG
jgi:hypothetical protein